MGSWRDLSLLGCHSQIVSCLGDNWVAVALHHLQCAVEKNAAFSGAPCLICFLGVSVCLFCFVVPVSIAENGDE